MIVSVEADSSTWNQTYGGPEVDWATSLITTSDGGYAITGVTLSFGNGQDVWLVKTDANGNVEWNKTYGGLDSDWAWSVIQTSDDGYAMLGITTQLDDDLLLIKTDSSGNMEWNKTYAIQNQQTIISIL